MGDTPRYIGAHVSTAGGLARAVENGIAIGANTLQVFVSSPQQWRFLPPQEEDVKEFRAAIRAAELGPVFVHAPYLINLASPDTLIRTKSEKLLAANLETANRIDAAGVIFHLGSAKGLFREQGVQSLVSALRNILDTVPGKSLLILENGSGGGGKIGTDFTELHSILRAVNSERVAVCFDTAHAFEAGLIDAYTPENIWKLETTIERTVGFSRLVAVHANDSKTAFNSHHDRHENIGEGFIGVEGFRALLNARSFAEVPWILEVPGFDDLGVDARNISILKRLADGESIMEE